MCKLSCAVITVNFIGDCITVAMAPNFPQMFACELFYDCIHTKQIFFHFLWFMPLFFVLFFSFYFISFYILPFIFDVFLTSTFISLRWWICFIFIHLKLYLLLFWLVRMRRQGSGSRHHVGGGSVLRCEGVRNKHENLKTKHCFMHTRVVTSN